MGNVFVEENSLQDIANAIREKNGTETKYLPGEMGRAVRDIQNGGENPLEYAVRCSNLYGKAVFPENTRLVLDLPNVGNVYSDGSYSFANMFDGATGILEVIISGNINNNFLEFTGMFLQCKTIEIVDLTNINITHISRSNNAFSQASKLKEIRGFLNLYDTTNVSSMFSGCTSLEEVRFVEKSIKLSLSFQTSPLLSDETIQSVINGLADLTGKTAQTLTFHADVKTKLTEEQIATITSKNWNLA